MNGAIVILSLLLVLSTGCALACWLGSRRAVADAFAFARDVREYQGILGENLPDIEHYLFETSEGLYSREPDEDRKLPWKIAQSAFEAIRDKYEEDERR
jgi:hypothetical protein